MNGALLVRTVGLLTLAFGIGLFVAPSDLARWAQIAADGPFGRGELRAAGGLILALGAGLLWAGRMHTPARHAMALFTALLFLGAVVARILHQIIETEPATATWGTVAIGLLASLALMLAWWLGPGSEENPEPLNLPTYPDDPGPGAA